MTHSDGSVRSKGRGSPRGRRRSPVFHPHPALRRLRRATRWALIGFTAVTVLAYVALAQGHLDAFGLADTLSEDLLIARLGVVARRARSS